MDVINLDCNGDFSTNVTCTGQVDTAFFAIPIIGFGLIFSVLVVFLIIKLFRD